MSAVPGLTELIGPTYTMDGWGSEENPECPLCLVRIKDGEEFYEAENTSGVVHWPCFLIYCVRELTAGREVMAPPIFRDTPVFFTQADYQRLVAFSGREWRNELGPQLRSHVYSTSRLHDGLALAHPKSMLRAAGERKNERRRQAKEDEDEVWSLGDA